MVGRPLRVAFFGTPLFAVPALEALLRSRNSVVGVVTQPDRPRGRGHKTTDAPVKALAVSAGLPVLQPPRMKDEEFLLDLAALDADLGVVAAYGRILTERILAIPRLGMVNVHASLLPRYRGAAPVHRAVIAGEQETGVTIMRVVSALDAGPMLAHARRPIGGHETSEEVEHDLAHLGAGLLVTTIEGMLAGTTTVVAQDEREATYAPRLTKDEGLVDWHTPASSIHNLIRGLHPWPHAFTYLGNHRLILHRSLLSWSEPSSASTPPGTVLDAAGDRLVVATGSTPLEITQIQAEGKRPMPTREFLAGHRLSRGDSFGGP